MNNVFDIDQEEINKTNKKYLVIFLIIVLLVLLVLLMVKKNYYYINSLIIEDNNSILLVDKEVANKVKTIKTLIINDIENSYSINKIIYKGNICYMDIKLKTNIESKEELQYKVLLGKESIFEYIVRVIKKN